MHTVSELNNIERDVASLISYTNPKLAAELIHKWDHAGRLRQLEELVATLIHEVAELKEQLRYLAGPDCGL